MSAPPDAPPAAPDPRPTADQVGKDAHDFWHRVAALPGSRWGKWVAVAGWLIVVLALAPYAASLTEAESNDAASFLPGNAESTKVLNLQQQLAGGSRLPAFVVYHRDGGLTSADKAKIAADQQAALKAVPQATLGSPVLISTDGTTSGYVITLPGTADATVFNAQVETISKAASAGANGMVVAVTGPAGFLYDSIKAFQGVDSTLLVVTILVVAVILLITYRSPFLWLLPLVTVGAAAILAQSVVYLLAKHGGLVVNGQSAGILTVLVFGAGTDYALLLIARYREELRRHEDKHEAMAFAMRRSGPAIVASGGTVIISMLCLLVAELNSDRGLGPVAAIGIASALLAMVTLLPALLAVFGRKLFWPFIPVYGSAAHEESGFWGRMGLGISHRPRIVWIGTTLALGVLVLGLLSMELGLSQTDAFRNDPPSVVGERYLEAAFPDGTGSPTIVITNTPEAAQVSQVVSATPGVASAQVTRQGNGLTQVSATLDSPPDSDAAYATVEDLRARVHAVPGADALVGGTAATNLDVVNATKHDRLVIFPLVLAVVLVVLGILLGSIVAPVLLIATVILSYLAALGASAFFFKHVFGYAGEDQSLPLFAFIFLVALGIDYNIFLMTRVREESALLGTRPGMRKGLAVTGGVITSAGIVLAATFSVLAVLPLVVLVEIGFTVAFGVLLDTLIVRSVLVPALVLDIGHPVWWPSRLFRRERDARRAELAAVSPGS